MIVCSATTILHRPAAFPLVGCGTVFFLGADGVALTALQVRVVV